MLTRSLTALALIAATAAIVDHDVRYALPVAPAFVVLALGALLLDRRPEPDAITTAGAA